MTRYIMAVDPGVDTGIALFDYEQKKWHTTVVPYVPTRLYDLFGDLVTDHEDITMICERFDYRPKGKYNFGGSRAIPKVDLTPREVIGILKLVCMQNDIEIVWQAPGDVNGEQGKDGKDIEVFWTDGRLKLLGLYKPGHVHEMDTVKHILYYRSFTQGEESLLHALRPTKITAFEEEMV